METKATHTPEPWGAYQKPDGDWVVCGADALTVAEVIDRNVGRDDPGELAANVRLIKAAPKMLAALRGARVLFMPRAGLPPDIEDHFRRMVAMSPELAAINEAIADAASGAIGDE